MNAVLPADFHERLSLAMTGNPYKDRYDQIDPPGANVRFFREQRDWSQVQLCHRVIMPNGKPLTPAGLSRIENNKAFTRAVLVAIANALERPLQDLLTPLKLLAVERDIRALSDLPAEAQGPIRQMIVYSLEAERAKRAARQTDP